MKVFLLLLILSLEVYLVTTGTIFCFPVCGGCNDLTYTNCTGGSCRNAVAFSKPAGAGGTYSCVKTPYTYYSTGAKWEPTAITPDIPMTYDMGTTVNITVQPLTPSPATIGTCINSSTTYSFYTLFGGDTFSVSHPGVVGNVFYY